MIAVNGDNDAEDRTALAVDRLICGVFGHEPYMALFQPETLYGGLIVDKGDDDLAVVSRRLRADDNDIIFEYGGVLHAVAPDIEGKQALSAALKGNIADGILDGKDRLSGADRADDRDIAIARLAGKGKGAGLALALLKIPVFLKDAQMGMDGGGRTQPDGVAYLAHRRRIAVFLGEALYIFKYGPAFGAQYLASHKSTPPCLLLSGPMYIWAVRIFVFKVYHNPGI